MFLDKVDGVVASAVNDERDIVEGRDNVGSSISIVRDC